MSFLRNVLHDLVEKRLWPVAVALLVALVAVPVVLGGGSDDSAEPATEAAATPSAAVPATSAKVVSLDEPTGTAEVTRKGDLRNPFKQQHLPKDTTTSTAQAIVTATNNLVSSGNGSSPASPSTGGSSPSGGGGGIQTPTPAPVHVPAKPNPKDLYRVDVRFGELGDLKTHSNVARLTPLPSAGNPLVVFLGLKKDGETAVFLVSSDAVPSGDGKCRPSTKACETVEMQWGDTELFDVQTGTAGVVQYRLDVRKVYRVSASEARAARAHARESKAGREWLRLTVASDPTLLDGWDYSKRLGILTERPAADQADDVANVPEFVAGDPAATAAEPQPQP
jgi:hypothetical protein